MLARPTLRAPFTLPDHDHACLTTHRLLARLVIGCIGGRHVSQTTETS